MRKLVFSSTILALAIFATVASAQDAQPPPQAAPAAEGAPTPPTAGPPATPEEDTGPTEVVVVATGGTDVTEEVLSQARLATVTAASAQRERHERTVRPERDPGLALRASNCGDDACLVAVGRDSQAAYLFVLMIERSDAGYRATVLMVDVSAGMTAGSAAFELPGDPATFPASMGAPLGPLVQAIAPIHATTGALTITVDHVGAAVFLDGERIGSSPLEQLVDIEQGEHEVRVTLEGFLDSQQTVQVIAEGEANLQVTLAPVPPEGPPPPPSTPIWRRWWFWTAIGAVVVGTGLGVGLGVGLSGDTVHHEQEGIEFPGWEER